MTEQCKGEGSVQKLVTNKWKTVGIGQLILLKNKHNPSHILLKFIRKKKNQIYMFQCKPKVKTNGKSLILKGTDTKKKKDLVLALRFDEADIMNKFHNIMNELYKKTQSSSFKSRHKRTDSTPPTMIKEQLAQYAWDCELCTFRNEPTIFDCEICKHPRPLKPALEAKRHSENLNFSDLPPIESPKRSLDLYPCNKSNSFGKKQLSIVNETDDFKSESFEKEEESSPISESKSSQQEEKSTIEELICKIMNGEEVSSIKSREVEDILLLCHDTFTDSDTMLHTLLNQLSDKNLVEKQVRIRGVNMAERWIKKYWETDFEYNKTMEDIMYGFIDNLADLDLPDSDIRLLERVRKLFEDKLNNADIIRKRQSTIRATQKLLGDIDIPKNYNIMSFSNQSIAEQITLMDFEIFKSIQKREMCGQAWKKKNRDERAPHLLDMIRQFNGISKWVQCVVLQQKNKTERRKCIEKFIRIAVQLRELRNFSACCAVNFGLSANVLFRLKDAWAHVSKRELKQYTEIQNIYKGKKNWELLRVLHKKATAPSILHTGLFLQDLLNTDEGNDDKKKRWNC
eukprot:783434_1